MGQNWRFTVAFFLEVLVNFIVLIYFYGFFTSFSSYSGWAEFYGQISTFIYGISLICSLEIISNNQGGEKKIGYFLMGFNVIALLFYFLLSYTRFFPLQVFYFRVNINQFFNAINSLTFVIKRTTDDRGLIQGFFDVITTILILGFALFPPLWIDPA
jgi:hypothetical protein